MKSWPLAFALLALSTIARADQWLPATPQTFTSSAGTFRLTVFPREIAGPLPYFEDKVEQKDKPGQRASGQRACEATLEELINGRYLPLWRKPLVNDVSPVTALVSDRDGSFVTFDNWHSMGWGDDAVVVYDGDGSVTRKLSLNDLFTQAEIDRMPRSVSSIRWHASRRIDDEEGVVIIRTIKSERFNTRTGESTPDYGLARLRMSDGAVLK